MPSSTGPERPTTGRRRAVYLLAIAAVSALLVVLVVLHLSGVHHG